MSDGVAGFIRDGLRLISRLRDLSGGAILTAHDIETAEGSNLTPEAGAFIVGTASTWEKVTGGSAGQQPQIDPDEDTGVRIGPKPLRAFSLDFGGNHTIAGRYLLANGNAGNSVVAASTFSTRAVVPIDCTLVRITVACETSTPDFSVHVNGAGALETWVRNGAAYQTDYDGVFVVSGIDQDLSAGDYIEVVGNVSFGGRTHLTLYFTANPSTDRPGIVMPYAGDIATVGDYAMALAVAGRVVVSSAGVRTRLPMPFDGTLTHVPFHRTTVASDTVVRIENHTAATSVDVTLPSSGTEGVVSIGSPLAVSEGDLCSVTLLSGTPPDESWIGVRFLADDTDRNGIITWAGGDPSAASAAENFVAQGEPQTAPVSNGAPGYVAIVAPRVRKFSDEGEGAILHSIIGSTETTADAAAAIQYGSIVESITIPHAGRNSIDAEVSIGDMVLLSPIDDAGDTTIGLVWE